MVELYKLTNGNEYHYEYLPEQRCGTNSTTECVAHDAEGHEMRAMNTLNDNSIVELLDKGATLSQSRVANISQKAMDSPNKPSRAPTTMCTCATATPTRSTTSRCSILLSLF